MTITYNIGKSLYINMTNACSNDCTFCVRNEHNSVVEGHSLWLDREPTVDEIIDDIKKRDLSLFDEIVFCGYGEPMMRTYDVIEIAKFIKSNYEIKTRINTNGQANLICKEDITPLLGGIIDTVSISLNAKNAKEYDELCKSAFGEDAFDALIEFAKKCTKHVPNVVMSVVDILPQNDIDECRKIAEGAGATLRVREMIE